MTFQSPSETMWRNVASTRLRRIPALSSYPLICSPYDGEVSAWAAVEPFNE